MKTLFIFITGVILTFLYTGCGESGTHTAEYKLAVISNGGYVKEDDITVKRFKYLLDSIQSMTNESYEDIGDMTVTTQNILRDKYGKKVNLLKLMESARKILLRNNNMKYKVALATQIRVIVDQWYKVLKNRSCILAILHIFYRNYLITG